MTGAAYIEQLSRHVRQGLDKSAQNSCYLIKRRIYSVTESELEFNCHENGPMTRAASCKLCTEDKRF